MKITDIQAIEVIDSRGNPTVRAFITLDDTSTHVASVPSGASTGAHEAVELRDNDANRFLGKGVLQAVKNVNTTIRDTLVNTEIDPNTIDEKLIALDGTPNKGNLGANALLAVSQAAVRARAHAENKSLWRFMNEYYFNKKTVSFPRLLVNIVNGGKHASWNFDIQEFMIVPNTNIPSDSVRIATEIFHSLGKLLHERNLSTLLGDEGGYSPATLSSNEEVLETIILAGKSAGYENGQDFRLSLDCAATEWFQNGQYISQKRNEEIPVEDLIQYYKGLTEKYQLLSIEDPLAEDDWENYKTLTRETDAIIIGDDLFVTNPKRIKRGIKEKSATAVLVKINQIGTIKETAEAINMTHEAGWKTAISHRSGETEDSFIADLSYACASEFIKAGSMARSERLAKYNRLLEIECNL